MIKQLIDSHFSKHYNLGRVVTIDETHTSDDRFDLMDDGGVSVVEFGCGFASFDNDAKQDIAILNYEVYIDKFAGTQFHNGRRKCDCILESETGLTVILEEITSSRSGLENLRKAIYDKMEFPGGKFEKAEQQLLVSLQTLCEIPEIAQHFASQLKRVCLCSYKLFTSKDMELIGNPVVAFSRGQAEAERQAGENGVKISSPQIEALGFEYRRISHSFVYCI